MAARDKFHGRVLIVAGSDSGGGAGIQADIKTVTALGGYATTAITALTAQNTLGVQDVLPVPPAFVRAQMRSVLDDIGTDAVKLGMLHDAGVIEAVADALPDAPLVVDPVMVAKGGASLLADAALDALKRRIIPRATILTPNAPEAAKLSGMAIDELEDMPRAGRLLLRLGAKAVLVKGGHLQGDLVHDVLVTEDGHETFTSPRVHTQHTHGTGCTLASAIATGLAQGLGLRDAVVRARAYLLEAIRHAPGLGHGQGPVEHGHTVRPFMLS
ncbi:MAG TPA: bifunctional hydroxymethylpyrimidine kinase/phosphomethylpyrimidine kinase [Alphaproteobacteria bacterium]